MRAITLLEYGRLPRFQECLAEGKLDEFNPYAMNVFVSHKWVSRESADDGRYFKHFVECLLWVVNRCLSSHFKLLDEDRASMNRMFNAEYFFDRMTACDLYAVILDPTQKELEVLARFLDLGRMAESNISMLLGSLNDINVWLDYMCVPQRPRTQTEDALFSELMLSMHKLDSGKLLHPVHLGRRRIHSRLVHCGGAHCRNAQSAHVLQDRRL